MPKSSMLKSIKYFLSNLTSEQEQATVRVMLGLLFAIYFYYVYHSKMMGGITGNAIYAINFYLVASISLLISTFYFSHYIKTHRIVSILLDTITATYVLIIGGLVTAAFYGGYLWISIANGLRFGRYYLYFSTGTSIVCFSIVIMISPFWQEHYVMGLGLMLWLLLLPLYVLKLINKLEAAVENADSANNAKSRFLENMSHELRTPMNSILGFSELLMLDAEDDETKTNIQEIISASDHLLALINQILDLATIESKVILLSFEICNLNDLLNESLSIIKPIADKQLITIDNKVNLSQNIKINVDRVRFIQILLNVLSNAVKYNSENGNIIIDYAFKNHMHCLSISDTGKGLTSEQKTHIFKPFNRAGAESSKIPGTGLGLTISIDLIEQMEGTISVESEVGRGSCFWIQIPRL